MTTFPVLPAEDFALWIATNKPHLVEIEEQIQGIGQYGEMDVRITVRAGQVEKLSFYGGKTWLKDKSLTQPPPSVNK